ncbi:MAG: hypothetical protein EU539_13560 [Promethearchaeota archaeon]|nr:MAG: hypothetical protein EU539_13560 [Candidatus Lokiarchaeota archaeon]
MTEEVPKDLQEIPKSDQLLQDTKQEQYSLEFPAIISGFQKGSQKFSQQFVSTLSEQLTSWSRDIGQGTMTGTELLAETLKEMTLKISRGLPKIENWFKINLETIINEFKEDFYHFLENKMENQKETANITNDVEEGIKNTLSNLSQDVVTKKIGEAVSNIQLIKDKVNQANHSNSNLKKVIENSSNDITRMQKEISNVSDGISKALSNEFSSFQKNLDAKLDSLNKELSSLKDFYSKMNNVFKKLQNAVDDLKEF